MDIAELEDFLSYQRAIRSFDTSRPVDDATVETLLRCATYAPSGGNRQTWRFIVLRDAAIKAELTQVYGEEAQKYLGRPLEGQTLWTDVPVLIVACSEKGGGGPSIFPAVQNLLLAARALGLGSVLTTLWQGQEHARAQGPRRAGRDRDARHRADRLAGPQIRPRQAQADRRGYLPRSLRQRLVT